MGKDLKGRELGKGLYQRKDGRYEARTKINGSDVSIYGFNLRELKKEFQELKEEAQNSIDFRRKHITLNEWFEEWFQTYKLPVVKETSVNSYRKIPFFGEAEEMLLQQKAKTDSLKKVLGNRFRATGEYADLVFVTTMGSLVLRYHAEKEIKKVVKEINEQEAYESLQEQREPHYFEDMYPHAIRHTFCSRCFEAGMQPKVVQSIMGHQHYSTTIDIYTHVSESKYQEEIGKFGRAVEPEEAESKEP